MGASIHGVSLPDSKIARENIELVRDTESPLRFYHSSRVYYFDALSGKHRGLSFDRELLYAGAMFHNMGVTIAAAPARSMASTGRGRDYAVMGPTARNPHLSIVGSRRPSVAGIPLPSALHAPSRRSNLILFWEYARGQLLAGDVRTGSSQ